MDISVLLNNHEVEPSFITKVEFKNNINSLLSSGSLIIRDSGNNFVNSGNLVIGLPLTIILRENTTSKIFKTLEYKISGVRNAGASDENSDYNLGGFIQVFFISNLYFIPKENKSHTGQSSDLVQKLSTYDNTLELKEIEDSDDKDSMTKRYQLKKSYYRFLLEDVLPFTTIKQDPSYCFVDINNSLHFISQKTLFSKPTKKSIVSAGSNLSSHGASHYERGDWYIGEGLNSLYSSLKSVNVYIDNETRLVEGSTDNVSTIQSKDYYFIDKSLMENISATHFGYLDSNYLKKDIIAFNKNNKKERNRFFRVSVQGIADFEIITGDILELIVENTSSETIKQGHILSGRYAIEEIAYTQSSMGMTLMNVTLFRPSISQETVKKLDIKVDNLYEE